MESLPAKTCTQCGELKLLTEYYKDRTRLKLRAACKICANAANVKYRAKHREENREATIAYNLKYYQENKEALNAYNRDYYAENKEAVLASARDYHTKNKEARNSYGREYKKNNPHVGSEAKRRRQARKLNNGVEKYTELQVLETYGTDCHICSGPVDLNNSRRVGHPGWETGLHIDHVIPISKGGPDVLDNVRPSHGQCNLKKNARVE
jgi:5-methylcytosine-specific restriction endonuclease McrA